MEDLLQERAPITDGDAPVDITRVPPEFWADLLNRSVIIPADLLPPLAGLPPDPYLLPAAERAHFTQLMNDLEEALEARYGVSHPWYLSRLNDYPPLRIYLLKES